MRDPGLGVLWPGQRGDEIEIMRNVLMGRGILELGRNVVMGKLLGILKDDPK